MIKYLRDQSHPQYSSCNIYRLTHMSYVPNTKSFHMTRPNHHLGWLSATAPFGSTNWGHETKEDPEIPPTLLLQVLGFLGCEKMGGKILDSNLYKPGYHLWLKNDTKVDGIFVNFKMAGCHFFSKSNVDGFTENYTKLVQKRKHAHLESVGCTQRFASHKLLCAACRYCDKEDLSHFSGIRPDTLINQR